MMSLGVGRLGWLTASGGVACGLVLCGSAGGSGLVGDGFIGGVVVEQPEGARTLVYLWGEGERAAGELAAADASRVLLRDGTGRLWPLDWGRVRVVEGPGAGTAEPYMELARVAWRARSRLGRGDPAAAEPLFERVVTELMGRDGPTRAAAYEGLVRARLARGAVSTAIEPWLGMIRGGEGASGFEGLPPLRAPGSRLLPALPPLAGVSGLIVSGASAQEPQDVAAALAVLYAAVSTGDASAIERTGAMARADGDVALVRRLVAAQVLPAEGLEWVVAELSREAGREDWRGAWSRAGLGLALVRGGGREGVVSGVLRLIEVRVHHGEALPYLGGVVLARAAEALEGLGDRAGASALAVDLRESFAGHPALDWPGVRTMLAAPRPMPGASASGAGAGEPSE